MQNPVPSNDRFDLYRAVTDKIVAAIEAGAGRFVMPWHVSAATGRPTNALTGHGYRGVNVVALWAEAVMSGYGTGWWASYRQWERLGAQVRRGQRGSVIVFYNHLNTAPTEDLDDSRHRLVARAFRVFNLDQVDGWQPPGPTSVPTVEALAEVEAFVAATKAVVVHAGSRACYRRDYDRIELPPRDRFRGTPTSSASEAYYGTLLHELTHWSGAPHRLDRTFGTRFGDNDYAVEELVAELGAAFLCADLGIANEPRPDHASYIASWLKVLNDDSRAVFTAAARANDSATYLQGFSEPEPS
ncbi:MAG: zincin-like metallopeptidase domain-containing protein [Brevundimonas sp.]|uniref:ArdC family protein n=1 Tax=Brevundimonas sp. TaxID=1871086 RepID=UPI002ABC4E92|nr:zincin-like metallopeptidase domain-containing protein [Brevundimonas sp.]MDZ4113422.1 zincin-like metallopeptidase domain-containing protein [Brevundimonas sp.]